MVVCTNNEWRSILSSLVGHEATLRGTTFCFSILRRAGLYRQHIIVKLSHSGPLELSSLRGRIGLHHWIFDGMAKTVSPPRRRRSVRVAIALHGISTPGRFNDLRDYDGTWPAWYVLFVF